MSAELVHIETPKHDAEVAKEHSAKLMPLLEQACAIMDQIRRDGMEPMFSLNFDGTRTRVMGFDIKKSML